MVKLNCEGWGGVRVENETTKTRNRGWCLETKQTWELPSCLMKEWGAGGGGGGGGRV